MEQLQVHSRSYIVRWIHVNPNESISWSLQPHKKGLNFGIFKHPGGKAGAAPNLPTSATLDVPPTPSDNEFGKSRRNSTAKDKDGVSAVVEKLQGIGLKCVSWTGKCEADKVSMGRFDVHDGEGGMYGLVFDNTFSKTVAKTATFVLLTHPTNAPPKSGAQLRYSQAQSAGSSTSVGNSPSLQPMTTSTESLPHDVAPSMTSLKIPRRGSATSLASGFYTGVMHKKRRKKNQGYARRFFSLDFTSSTLSYYRNSHASALRGSVPLSLAAVGVDEKRKEFSIDSGAEVWHLRLRNKKDFDSWRRALEKATTSIATPSPAIRRLSKDSEEPMSAVPLDPAVERDWHRVEQLIGRVSGSRDAVRRLAQDTDPKYNTMNGQQASSSPSASPVESNPFFQDLPEKEPQKLPFWKRKPSSGGTTSESRASLLRRSFSAQGPTTTTAPLNRPLSPAGSLPKIRAPSTVGAGEDIHDRCMALLRDLDATVSEFSSLLSESKARRRPPVSKTASRMSMESSKSVEDFFDAEEAPDAAPQMMSIRHSDEVTDERDDFFSDDESLASTTSGPNSLHQSTTLTSSSRFPTPPKTPLPSSIPSIKPRTSIPPPRQPPPSIVSFLRKNAGKDLSTVAMPVTANEPLSLLQRMCEPLENASVLALAAAASSPLDRLTYITAFAMGTLAANRVKERAVRKPFNPMLGETYELVRPLDPASPDKGTFRFLAEKVNHHPVRMAWQADDLAGKWSVAQTPRPVQKFWGKSVEVNTEGRFRVTLSIGEREEKYSWASPTAYLRNVIAGEKYVEPTGSMTVVNETDGGKAVVSFKAAGMFSGRSEEANVVLYSAGGEVLGEMKGTWTGELNRDGKVVWKAGETVSDASKNWGFTVFAAGLNEVTAVEEGKMPMTDSRLRPDQRALERGELDVAEGLKAKLEERQRGRRKVMEVHGRAHMPTWFEKVDCEEDEELWRLRAGKDGYWERRERGDWKGVVEVFET
ncbi:hypothetical protein CAC42_4039 [Sphaceloma murrayae]|uniref:PH domain-containing protein n=1 Tax=Sphaceloma murrayae TaxID=2082308 RepID=A0A2K1QT25_9PEZI|nr:hypothetical protein CAC42_4039 [Sphaceloma murrayae]